MEIPPDPRSEEVGFHYSEGGFLLYFDEIPKPTVESVPQPLVETLGKIIRAKPSIFSVKRSIP